MDVKSAGEIVSEGSQKDAHQQAAAESSPGNPFANDQKDAEHTFEPGQNKSRDVDQLVREDLIIVNDFGKCLGMANFIEACPYPDDPKPDPANQEHPLPGRCAGK